MKGELIVFVLIGISIVASGFMLSRMVLGHIRKIQTVIEKLSRGELVGDLELDGRKDEMGRLMAALNDLHQHLKVIVGEVNKWGHCRRKWRGCFIAFYIPYKPPSKCFKRHIDKRAQIIKVI